MLRRILWSCACVLAAHPAAAGPIVTWEGFGAVLLSNAKPFVNVIPPPIGTPVSYTLSFDPALSQPTSGLPGTEGCVMVPVSASISIGGIAYSGSGIGYTKAQLPGSNCVASGNLTQFSLHGVGNPPGTPWPFIPGESLLVLDYFDPVKRDAFPTQPPASTGSLFLTGKYLGAHTWNFSAPVSIQAVDQLTPVPEPGTLTLVGIGLAAVVRGARSRRAPKA